MTRAPDEIQRIKEIGLECLGRLHRGQTWEDWMGVGAALEIITDEALAAVNATAWDKNNRRLVKEFDRRWDDYEAGNHKPLSKQERYALREVMSNPPITAYRNTLTEPEKRRLNHPNAVINRWKRQKPTEDKPLSPFKKLEAAHHEVLEKLHRLEKNGDGNLFTKDSPVKEIASAIIGTFDGLPNKVSRIDRIAHELLDWVNAQKSSGAATQPRRG